MKPKQIRRAMEKSAKMLERQAELVQECHSINGEWDKDEGMDREFVRLLRNACDLRIASRFVK